MCCVVSLFIIAAAPPPVSGTHIVSADHVLIKGRCKNFQIGGNSVDAAVAARLRQAWCNQRVAGWGRIRCLVRQTDTKSSRVVIDFREVAPSMSETMFQDDKGRMIPGRSRIGGHAVAVPAEGIGLAYLCITMADCLSIKWRSAIELADRGFVVGAQLATALR